MYKQPNFLRPYRKSSMLTVADLAFLMETSNHSLISRYEKGVRTPTIELLLIYHLLFDTSVESFFETQRTEILEQLPSRLRKLRATLLEADRMPKVKARIHFLDQAYKRLTTEQYV